MENLEKLFEPIKLGAVEFRNRIVMTGFAFTTAEDTARLGVIHQKYIDFFEERARGGVGLIIIPDTAIDRELRALSHPCIGGVEFNPGLSALVDAVHVWGTKIAPDLFHNGYRADPTLRPHLSRDWRPLSSSPISFGSRVAREMNTEEIKLVEKLFGEAAGRARLLGFDAIHIAGHFGFLIAQFLSPYFNKRTDKYGGSLENRMRFALEIIDNIKREIGNKIPIIFKLSVDEFVDGGLTVQDNKLIARRLEQAGVDALGLGAGLDLPGKHHNITFPPMGSTQGLFVDMCARIKEVVSIPTIVGGRITDPLFAESILRDGKADMVAMARQLVADPELPLKSYQGRLIDIVPCIGCNVCAERLLKLMVSRCSVNAALGREKEFTISRTEKPLKIMIVGGGPAGMEAARVASLRGHEVSLFERKNELGGQLNLASQLPWKSELIKFKKYLENQLVELGVKIKLGVEVTPDVVRANSPDVVIVATGSNPLIPGLNGINELNVMTAWDVLSGKETGKNVAIAGGGMVGCETAEFLYLKGKRVTIVEMLSDIALDMETTNRIAMMERFEKYELRILVNSTVEAVTERGLQIKYKGRKKVVDADTIVIAMGSVANNKLAGQLRNIVKSFYVIGDCFEPKRIVDAINHASSIARQI